MGQSEDVGSVLDWPMTDLEIRGSRCFLFRSPRVRPEGVPVDTCQLVRSESHDYLKKCASGSNADAVADAVDTTA